MLNALSVYHLVDIYQQFSLKIIVNNHKKKTKHQTF